MSALPKPEFTLAWSILTKWGEVRSVMNTTWPGILEYITTQGPFRSKDDCPWLKLATFGDKITPRGSTRSNENLLQVYGLEGDYDAKQVSVQTGIERLERHGIKAAIVTTASHTDQEPRWRVICPLSKPVPPSERAGLLARLNGALGGILANESFTDSQAFYFGRVQGTEFDVARTYDDPEEGEFIDLLDDLDQVAIGKKNVAADGTRIKPVIDEFKEKVTALGRKLVEGDGRREMLKKFVASRSARGLRPDDLMLALKGVVAEYFDPKDPIDDDNIFAIVAHYVVKDSAGQAQDPSELVAGFDIDPDTGEILLPEDAPHPLANFLQIGERTAAPAWVITGLVAEGVTVFAGGWGAGKTTAILPLSMCAAGLHRNGDPLAPKHWRHVVYVAEDVNQAQRIISGLVNHADIGIELDDVRERFHLVQAKRLDADHISRVAPIYRKQFARTVGGVEILPLVVFDTRNAIFAMDKEEDNAEASRIMAILSQNFSDLSVWLVGHIAKANMDRKEAAGLSSRGAGAWDADAQQTMFVVVEDDRRYLATGKKRFEPKWQELVIQTGTHEEIVENRFGDFETVTLRWGIPTPPEESREAVREQAKEQRDKEQDVEVRTRLLMAIEEAHARGEPLSKTTAAERAKCNMKKARSVLNELIDDHWVFAVTVPLEVRANNSRSEFLVRLTDSERRELVSDGVLPESKMAIPASWKKPTAKPDTSAGSLVPVTTSENANPSEIDW